MTITSSTPLANPYHTGAAMGSRRNMHEFKGLANALQSGDLTSAQSAFTKLQDDLKAKQANGKSSPLLDETTAAGKDFKALQDALKAGDVKAAESAFATLKQDVRKTHGQHSHHKVDNDGDADDNSASATSATASDSASAAPAATPTLDVMA